MTFLSQLDPVYFTNSVNKETIEKSYKSFFQIFGGEHVSLMLRGAGEEGGGVTTGAENLYDQPLDLKDSF